MLQEILTNLNKLCVDDADGWSTLYYLTENKHLVFKKPNKFFEEM